MKISCQTTIITNFKLDITSPPSTQAPLTFSRPEQDCDEEERREEKLSVLHLVEPAGWSGSLTEAEDHHGPRCCLELTGGGEAVMSCRRTGWRTLELITLLNHLHHLHYTQHHHRLRHNQTSKNFKEHQSD